MSFFRTTAHIDLEALQNNVLRLKNLSPQSHLLAMVKSNAYGHGAIEISKTLKPHVKALGVASLPEALELHSSHISSRIVIWGGFLNTLELETMAHFGFETTIHNEQQLDILESTTLDKPIHVWLKIDTGMHRLGFHPHEIKEVYRRLTENPNVCKPLHYMTHFSDADRQTNDKTDHQRSQFLKITDLLPGYKGMANSAALLQWPKTLCEWARPGILLYGISPIQGISGQKLAFDPVMTLTSKLISIKKIDKGEAIGYGSSFICPEDKRIGIVAIGYGDGYPWHIKNSSVILKNTPCPLVGRVSMDYVTVDITSVPSAQVGDSVILWGKDLPVETIALLAGTSSYELCCQLTKRVEYRYYQKSRDIKEELESSISQDRISTRLGE